MRGIEELDHYEMLEIARGATSVEIDRAYRLAQQTYAEGSLALYSIFEKRDAAEIRARLDEAYRVLADPELRSTYDLEHRTQPAPGSPPASTSTPASTSPSASSSAPRATNGSAAHAPSASSPRPNGTAHTAGHAAGQAPVCANGASAFEESVESYDAREDDGTGEFDGPRLRRTRLFRGFEIDQIADVTKVAGSHLRNIEDENYADLPADVYVRGFVTAYAKTIGLDPQAVVPSYMARLQDSRQKSQKSRFLGLR